MSNATKIIQVENKINEEDLKQLVESISQVKLWVLFFVIITIIIIIIQTLKTCGKVYKVHNERVIRQHSGNITTVPL